LEVIDRTREIAPRSPAIVYRSSSLTGRKSLREETMSLTGILLGIISIAVYIAILVLIGLVVVWFASWLGFAIPAQIQKVYMIIVALIALYLIIALLLGLPVPGPIRLGALAVIA
jgi:MFS superfamily sulfate permease-like transporter